MIKSKSQIWEPGRVVKIGSLELIVESKEPTPGDGKPDAYHLSSMDRTRSYRFQPFNGLIRTDDSMPVKSSDRVAFNGLVRTDIETDAINANEIISHTLLKRQAG